MEDGFFGQNWPFNYPEEGYLAQQTISGKVGLYLLGTLIISYILFNSGNKLNISKKDIAIKSRTSGIALHKPLLLLHIKNSYYYIFLNIYCFINNLFIIRNILNQNT